MKKLFTVILLSVSLSSFAQQAPKKDTTAPANPNPELTLQGKLDQFQVLLSALKKSSAPYDAVSELVAWIERQLIPQLQPKKQNP